MTLETIEHGVPDGYMTVESAADLLGIDANSIVKAISRGRIQGAFKSQVTMTIRRTMYVIPQEEIIKYGASRHKRRTKAEMAAKKQKEQTE